jgi:hypothetical protein
MSGANRRESKSEGQSKIVRGPIKAQAKSRLKESTNNEQTGRLAACFFSPEHLIDSIMTREQNN